MKTTHELLQELADFGQANDRGRCFAGWPRGVLEDYLGFHLAQGTLGFVRHGRNGKDGRNGIVGLAVGWQLEEREVRVEGFVERPFQWQATNPKGDSFYFAPLIVKRGCPEALGALVEEFRMRWPQWRNLKLFAGRRGKLVEYRTEILGRVGRVGRAGRVGGLEDLPGWKDCLERAAKIVAEHRALLPKGLELYGSGGGSGGPPPRDLYSETAGELKARLDLAPAQFAAEAQYRPQYAALDLQSIRDLIAGTAAGKRTVQTTQMRKVPGQKLFLPGGQSAPAGFSMLSGQSGFAPGWRGGGDAGGSWWQGPELDQPYQVSSEIDVAAQPGLVDLFGQVQPQLNALDAASLHAQRAAEIGDVESLGPRAVAAWNAANPQNQVLLGKLNDSAVSALGNEGGLTREELEAALTDTQGAWASRGLGMSPGAAIAQSIAAQEARRRRLNENRAFATGVVGLNSATSIDPFMALLGRPASAPGQANALLGQSSALSRSFGPELFGSSINANDVYNTNFNAAAARDISDRNNAAAKQGAYISGGAALAGAGIMAGVIA